MSATQANTIGIDGPKATSHVVCPYHETADLIIDRWYLRLARVIGWKSMEEVLAGLKSTQYNIDRRVVDYSIKLLQPFYEERREAVKQIPKFWATVVTENQMLQPYISLEDAVVLETVKDFYVCWDQDDSRNADTWWTFGDNPHFPAQTLYKRVVWNELDNEDGYYSSPSPTPIKEVSNLLLEKGPGGEQSLLRWLNYTDSEDTNVREEFTAMCMLFLNEIFPSAISLYEAAQHDNDVLEEYDISDDELAVEERA